MIKKDNVQDLQCLNILYLTNNKLLNENINSYN